MPFLNFGSSKPHPFYPNGEWEGHYYQQGKTYPMTFELQFEKGNVTGKGEDEVGSFTWHGAYSEKPFYCQLTKRYEMHEILYYGKVDENGIWGSWHHGEDKTPTKLSGKLLEHFERAMRESPSGAFHIWPKGLKNRQEKTWADMIDIKGPYRDDIEEDEYTKNAPFWYF